MILDWLMNRDNKVNTGSLTIKKIKTKTSLLNKQRFSIDWWIEIIESTLRVGQNVKIFQLFSPICAAYPSDMHSLRSTPPWKLKKSILILLVTVWLIVHNGFWLTDIKEFLDMIVSQHFSSLEMGEKSARKKTR